MKTIFIFLSCIIIYSSCTSQPLRSYGIKAGYVSAGQKSNANTWYTDYNRPYTKRRSGIDFGVYVEWWNMPAVSLLTEMHYIQKGIGTSVLKTDETRPDGWGEYYINEPRADYISFPMMAMVRLSDSQISPYLIAGPRVDLLVDTKGAGSEFMFHHLQFMDIGVTLGAGLDLSSVIPFRLGLEFRYSPSLKNAYSAPHSYATNNSWELLLVVGT